jgi:hypothetical protein
MRVLAIGTKHALDVAIERPQDADARVHQEVATFSGADQATDRGLPFLGVLLSLRQFHDVIGGVLQRDKLPPAEQSATRYCETKAAFTRGMPSGADVIQSALGRSRIVNSI